MPVENKIKSKEIASPVSTGTQFFDPRRVINQLEIYPGMKVAHFGCGVGYFTFPIAERVGETGIVWALDILEHKIELMQSNIRTRGLQNIKVKRANLEMISGSGLEDDSADWVIMVNMLYQNSKRSRIVGEAKRVIKEKGKILLIDWKSSNESFGPNISDRITREDLIKTVRKNGLGIAKELEIGALYFGMILTK